MVVGVAGGRGYPCVVLCRYLTRWYSRVDVQGVRQEIADSLKVCLKAALDHYNQVRGRGRAFFGGRRLVST